MKSAFNYLIEKTSSLPIFVRIFVYGIFGALLAIPFMVCYLLLAGIISARKNHQEMRTFDAIFNKFKKTN